MTNIFSITCMSDFDCTYSVNLFTSKDLERLNSLCNGLNKKVQEYISVNGYDIRVTNKVFDDLNLYSEIIKVYPEKSECIYNLLKNVIETTEVCLIGDVFLLKV